MEHIGSNTDAWEAYYESKEPHTTPLPGDWGEKLELFQQMVILRCIRPDAVVPACTAFVQSEMSARYVQPPPFDLLSCFNDSNCVSPLIFILSPGQDPLEHMYTLARKMDYMDKLKSTSLGQGQGPIATAMIDEAVVEGNWVLLQNCHLAPSWMPILEQICETFDPDKTAVNFRLWLTSSPSASFPVAILQNGIKMTNEPPKGLKANVRETYLSTDEQWFEASNKPAVFKKLLYAVSLFHAVIQERRTFGGLGWNIQYEYNDTDYSISVKQLQLFIDQYEDTKWEALNYLMGQLNYGGRVTDDHDRTTLVTLLRDYLNADVLDDTYRSVDAPDYYLPPEGSKQSYIDHLDTVPDHDDPRVFGLHPNAEITKALNETQDMLLTVLSMQPATASGGGRTPEEVVDDLADDILSKLPEQYDVETAEQKYPVNYDESMNTVLVQELVRYNGLTAVVRQSLVDLRKAMKGLVVMSAELEAVFKSVSDGRVPEMWASHGYPSLKPLGTWVVDLLQRLEFLQTWLENGPPPSFWISGFFFTQSFLTGTLQNFARAMTIPIDMLAFDCAQPTFPAACTQTDGTRVRCADYVEQFGFKAESPPELGCYIHGLYIEGCTWDADNNTLTESEPKTLFVQMPTIHIVVAQSAEMGDRKNGYYAAPVYRTTERRGTLSTTVRTAEHPHFSKGAPRLTEHFGRRATRPTSCWTWRCRRSCPPRTG